MASGRSSDATAVVDVDADAPGMYLVMGEDEFLRARASSDIVARERRLDPDIEILELDCPGLDPGRLAEALGLSLFARRRLVRLDDVQDCAKDLAEAIGHVVRDGEADLTLVLVHSGGARNKALADLARKAGAEVHDCARLARHEDRVRFVRREAERVGGSISAAATAGLLDAVGNDLRDLSAATGQLVSDAGGRIEADDVARYHRGRAEISGFTVADRALAGDLSTALEALRWAQDRGVAPVLIADALAEGVRTVSRVVSVGRGEPGDLARRLGLPPWKVKKAQQQARGWQVSGLHEALQIVARVNADVKGVAASADYALENAVRQLVSAKAGMATAAAAAKAGGPA